MAELIAGLFELIASLFELIAAFFEILLHLIIGTFSVILYAISPWYRRKRQQAWGTARWKKYTELGGGSVCFVALVTFASWTWWPRPPAPAVAVEPEQKPILQFEKPATNEDLRFAIGGPATNVFAIKAGGLKEIFQTKTIKELTNSLNKNVIAVPPTNVPGNLPFDPTTNKPKTE